MAHAKKGAISFYIIIALILGAITYIEFAIIEYEIPWLSSSWIVFWLIALSLIKFALVVAIYMHLRDDDPMYTGFFASGMVIALGTFIVLPLLFTVRSVANLRTETVTEVHELAEPETLEDFVAAVEDRDVREVFRSPTPKNQGFAVELPQAPAASFNLRGLPLFGLGAVDLTKTEVLAEEDSESAEAVIDTEEQPTEEVAEVAVEGIVQEDQDADPATEVEPLVDDTLETVDAAEDSSEIVEDALVEDVVSEDEDIAAENQETSELVADSEDVTEAVSEETDATVTEVEAVAEDVAETTAESVETAIEAVEEAAESTEDAVVEEDTAAEDSEVSDIATDSEDVIEAREEADATVADVEEMAEAVVEDTAEAVEAGIEAVVEAVDGAVDAVEGVAETVAEEVAETVEAVAEAVTDSTEAVAEGVAGVVESISEAVTAEEPAVEEPVAEDPARLELLAQAEAFDWQAAGERVYGTYCVACHQVTGQGIPGAFPPLAGHTPELYAAEGGREYLIKLVLYGLQGPIEVAGMNYNGIMTPWAQLSNDDIAAAINHSLVSWDNAELIEDFIPIVPSEVEALRGLGLAPGAVLEFRPELP